MTSLPTRLRVVFTGHAGTSKGRVVERFARYVQDRLTAAGETKTVAFADAEAHAKPMSSFLPLDRPSRELAWRNSLAVAIEKCRGADYAFLSLHLSYRWYNRFLSPLSWRPHGGDSDGPADFLVKRIANDFEADYCVCLIDDIQASKRIIASGAGGFELRISELLAWRNIETVLTDLLAQQTVLRPKRLASTDSFRFPFEHSPVVSVRHPQEMLFRYLFDRDRLRVYASFPIRRTRGVARRRAEIDDFRAALHREFCVFDPVTIDELPLLKLLDDPAQKRKRHLTLSSSTRWPLEVAHTLSGEPFADVTGLHRGEIEEINRLVRARDRTEIDFSVEERDLRLVDQADCVVVYRPQYSTGLRRKDKGYQQPTGGTGGEIDYAMRTAFRPVYVVHDSVVDGDIRRWTLDRPMPIAPDNYIYGKNLAEPANRKKAFKALVTRLKRDGVKLVAERRPTVEV